MKGTGVIPVRQARSQLTVERLMLAAEELFAARGIDEVSVPELAAHAGIAVGTFYGRFEDRSAFLRAYFDRFFERGGAPLTAEVLLGGEYERSAAGIITALIAARVRHYQRNRSVLRAILTYARTNVDPEFRKRAGRHTARTFEVLFGALAEHRAEIQHADPDVAIRFAVFMVETALKDTLLHGDRRSRELTFTDAQLRDELTLLALRYLGLTVKS